MSKEASTDPNSSEQKPNDAKVILYLGEDEGFWQDVKQGFKAFKQINFEFNLLYERDPQKIQSFIKLISEEKPRVVFIDLEKNTEEMLHLLRVQQRLNGANKPFLVALCSYTQGDEIIKQAILSGAQSVHVKSAETEAVVYDSICFAFHNALEHHGFAMAKLSDQTKAYFPAKVSLISPKGVRVESNYRMKVGEEVILNNYWASKAIINTRFARLGSQANKDLFYDFDYAQELVFEDPVLEIPEDTEPEEAEALKAQHEKDIIKSKESIKKWTQEAKHKSAPKLMKTLVIDKELTLYCDQSLTDSFSFIVRAQPFLIKAKEELMRLMPQMIAYQMEEVDPEELEGNQDLAYMYNEGNNLQALVKNIKSIGDYAPFIVVFNTNHDTKKLQSVLNYPQIIGHKEMLSPELIKKMSELLMKKLFEGKDPIGEEVVVLDKKAPESYAEFESSISLVACSENDIYFNSEEVFEVGTVFRLSTPANMYVTIAEPPAQPKAKSSYYGVLHGIGETEKKELRRFINSVFFRAREAAREKEREEVEMLKERYLVEKFDDEDEAESDESAQASEDKESETEDKLA